MCVFKVITLFQLRLFIFLYFDNFFQSAWRQQARFVRQPAVHISQNAYRKKLKMNKFLVLSLWHCVKCKTCKKNFDKYCMVGEMQ